VKERAKEVERKSNKIKEVKNGQRSHTKPNPVVEIMLSFMANFNAPDLCFPLLLTHLTSLPHFLP
jgi:hypothetical protein